MNRLLLGNKKTLLFRSATIGLVDAYTVVVTFTRQVSASNYATGVTIKKNTVSQTISSATRQTDKRKVYYVLSTAVAQVDALTWEYAAASGNIVDYVTSTALANVSARSVTNNISYTPGMNFNDTRNSMYIGVI